MTLLLCALAAVALHRLWHHEAVFSWARARVVIPERLSPLLFAPLAAALTVCPPVLLIVALYAPLRAAVWAYEKYDPPAAGCGCADKQHAMIALQTQLRSKDKRVIVVGLPPEPLHALAVRHPNWWIIQFGNNTTNSGPNVMPWVTGKDMIADLFQIILNGGNATIVTYDKLDDPVWRDIIAKIGSMAAVSWVHIVPDRWNPSLPKPLPAHHGLIITALGLYPAIESAQPPTLGA